MYLSSNTEAKIVSIGGHWGVPHFCLKFLHTVVQIQNLRNVYYGILATISRRVFIFCFLRADKCKPSQSMCHWYAVLEKCSYDISIFCMANSHGISTVSFILYPSNKYYSHYTVVQGQNKISFTDHVNMFQLNKITRNLPSTCTFEKTENSHMCVDVLPPKFHLNNQLIIQGIRAEDSKFSDGRYCHSEGDTVMPWNI